MSTITYACAGTGGETACGAVADDAGLNPLASSIVICLMLRNVGGKQVMEKWQAESLQAVVFYQPDPSVEETALKIWDRVFDTSPDGFQKNPNMQSVANGSADGAKFILQHAPARIDLFLQPSTTDQRGLPFIEDFEGGVTTLVEAAKRIAAAVRPVRLALVTQLHIQVPKPSDAVERFNKLTPGGAIPLGATDLNFTLNMRKKLGGSSGQINRLVRWFTGQLQLMQLEIGNPQSQHAIVVDQPALFLVIDVNSVPADIDISGKSSKIFDAMVTETKQIREKGYAAFVS